ncbi:ABC transporter permease [Rhodococcoides kroppenstedtii]|uniref:ABC transporter permease n=1 Tax=Rhodococcoides kroppenstedtii TaxID=293050 RepID=UPI0028E8ECE0|nr:ABC transporter permease [Rhodococcus kroppenstedtii]
MTTTVDRPRFVPAHGGFSLLFLGLELRRLLRNRRTLVFTLVIPPVFFAVFGLSGDLRTETVGSANVTGYVMVSMALYGAMLATTSGGAMVSIERGVGWTRQLRLTPLDPVAYVATKILVAMALGLVSVTTVFVVGALTGAHLTATAWVTCFVLAWLTSVVFAAFGLFMGYVLPSENVMQILGPGLALLAFAGGLFVPASGWFADVARVVPTWGVATIARAPIGDVTAANLGEAIVNVVVWTAVFVLGARVMFRRDTARG